jgi:nicotinamidase/pyrazinamidase
MNTKGEKIALLIVDPQNDFCSHVGTMFTDGADEDNNRLANWILEKKEEIDQIVVTLDSHYIIDISHPKFWVDQNGENPEPFTIIKSSDVISGKYKPTYSNFNEGVTLTYLEKLEEQGDFEHCIWPEHCITGTWGSAIDTVISGCLREWSISDSQARFVRYITKGSHPMTEHFGIFKAQIAISNANETHVNMSLIEQLDGFDVIYLAGQSRDFGIANSLKQIMELSPIIAKKIVILEDTMSSSLENKKIHNIADSIFEKAKELGVRFETTINK